MNRNILQVRNVSFWGLLAAVLWILVILVGYYFLYEATYFRSHEYNFVQPQYFLRNAVLLYTTEFPRIKMIAFIPIVWMLLTLASMVYTSTQKKEWFLVLAFSVLSFLPLPLIEQRYYLIAYTLILLLMPGKSRWVEIMSVATSAFFAFGIVWKTAQGGFFL